MRNTLAPLLSLILFPAFAFGALPTIEAPRVDAPVHIDGRLDEPFWQKAPEQSEFHVLAAKGGGISKDTSVRVVFDGQAIIFGITCRQNMSQLVAAVTKRDGNVFADDSVEIFLQHNNRYYYHFATNALGTEFDARYPVRAGGPTKADIATGASWNGVWQAAGHRGSDAWTIEVRIPLATLEIGPEVPTQWRLNIGRTVAQTITYMAWAPVVTGFHDLSRFGYLTGIEIPKGQFPLTASDFSFPPMVIGDNHLPIRIPSAEDGSFRLRAWLGDPQADPRDTKPIADQVLSAEQGTLNGTLTVPVRTVGDERQLVVEIDRKDQPVLLRSDLFSAPAPLSATLDWAVYYDSDPAIRINGSLNISPGFNPGRLTGTMIAADGTKTAVSAEASLTEPGAFTLNVPLKNVPDGIYRVDVTAEVPGVGHWTKQLQLLKIRGPFD